MQSKRAVRAAGLGVVGALALAGCASSQPDAVGQAWQQARTQLDEAGSLRLTTAYTQGQGDPAVVTWDIAGQRHGQNGTTVGTLGVGEDSRVVVETRVVDGQGYVKVDLEGEDVPADVRAAYPDSSWTRADDAVAGVLDQQLDRIGLPAADALADADVQPEEVQWSGGTAHRYAVPAEVADAAVTGGADERLVSFTVDDDGTLVGLRVETDAAEQEYTLSDWDEIEPAVVPEEVAE